MITRIVILLSILFILAGCQPAAPAVVPTAAPLKLVFMAGYKPQANLPFVGVYVAQAKGFFTAQSLEVQIEHSSGKGEHLQLLAAGKVQVTTQDAAVLLQRRADPGLPLVSIALLGQRGQQAFAALASSGMKSPKDWEGHTVGYKGTPPPDLNALIRAAGADPAKIRLVNVGFDPRLLTEGKVDVYPVYKSNEPYLIQKWGYQLTLWDAGDFGVPGLGLAYVTSESTLKDQPEALTRFLRAALQGVRYAADHRDEAVEITLKYTGPETDRSHMRFMLDSELLDAESPVTKEYGLGWQTLEQWQRLAEMLYQQAAMPQVNAVQVFSNAILEKAKAKDLTFR